MKKILVIWSVAGLLIAAPALAQTGMMQWFPNNTTAGRADPTAAINVALQDIYKSQNITGLNQVICSKATDDQFEKLGDAYMGYGITPAQHTAMENMMGGEGSATLKQAHINIGRAYLGCWSSFNSNPVAMPMMGYNSASSYPLGMMGYFGTYSWFGGITMLLVWILLIVGIIVLVRWLKHKN